MATMTVELIVGDVVKESLSVDDRSVPTAPTLSFFNKWARGCPPAVVAHDHTGRDPATGEWHLGIAVRNRNNGMTRIEADLWRLPSDLSNDAQELLAAYWQAQNHETPASVRKKMEHHFGPTHFQFDTLQAEAGDWRDFLTVVLSDAGSYAHVLTGVTQTAEVAGAAIPAVKEPASKAAR